jgi:hypothetical protein
MSHGIDNTQAHALESVILESAGKILGCSSTTCYEAVRGGMGLGTLIKESWWCNA